MKTTILSAAIILILTISVSSQTTEFTYQGSLQNASAPANGDFDFEFRLFDAVSGGTQIGGALSRNGVVVANGVFSVNLAFSTLPPPFSGADRYLEIRVRATGGGTFVALSPRSKVNSSPYAIQTLNAATAASAASATTAVNVTGVVQIANGGTGSTSKNFVDLTTNQTNIAGNKTFTGILSGNGSGLTNVNAAISDGSITTSKLADGAVTAAKLAPEVLLGTDTPSNAKLLAMKRWDQLRELRVFALTVPVNDLAWDGQTFWILDTAGNCVHKLNVGSFTVAATFPVGTQPSAIVFDGANIWTANRGSNNLTKLRASDGTNLGTFPVATPPRMLAFDGINIWANVGSPTNTQVAKLRAVDGAPLGTFNCGANVAGMEFDGGNIWCGGVFNIQKIRAIDGVGSSVSFSSVTSLVFDGSNMWGTFVGSLNRFSGNGSVLDSYTTCVDRAMAFDGTDVLVICQSLQQIYRHSTTDGSVIAIYSLPFEPGSRWAFDGKNVWISNAAPGDRLVRLPPPIR